MRGHVESLIHRLEEPFRIFFPVGVFWGFIGVALWPLFYVGWLGYYPSLVHPRLMIDGFAGFFIFGFIMTAGPRLLGVSPFAPKRVLLVFTLSALSCVAFVLNKVAVGDALFGLGTAALLFEFAKAFRGRSDLPPPGFPLAGLGLSCACAGSFLLAFTTMGWANALGRIMLFQGFTVLPVIGVGAFFFPKILGGENRHEFPEMRVPSAAWNRRLRHSIFVALGLAASVVVELLGMIQLAYAVRLVCVAVYLLSELPWFAFRREQSMHGMQLIFSVSTILIGLLGAALFPGYRIAWLHAYFIVGLTGVIFLVSIRVVFGHIGRPDLIRKSVKVFPWVTGALALATATRIYADYHLELQRSHYFYASTVWLVCASIWMCLVAPKTTPPKVVQSSGSC